MTEYNKSVRDSMIKLQGAADGFVGLGKVLLIGDSIIESLMLSTQFLKGNRYFGAGYAGSTLPDIRALAPSLIALAQPSKIVIHVGANDILQWQSGFSAATFGQSLAAFVASIRQQVPNIPIVVSTILPFSRAGEAAANLPTVYNGVTYNAKSIIDPTNVEIRNRATSLGLGLIDANAVMSGPDGYIKPALVNANDSYQLHPSAAGAAVLIPLFEAAI